MLEEQWPAAIIRILANLWSNHVLEWRLRLAKRELAGALDRTGQVVELEGDVRACAAFAQWLRAQVPDTYRLLFYHERYTVTIDLHQAMTEAVVQFTHYIRLVSLDPAKNRSRFYLMSWQPTLAGSAALVCTWGRLGTRGRSRMLCTADQPNAQDIIARLIGPQGAKAEKTANDCRLRL